jgi:hypothetical protein
LQEGARCLHDEFLQDNASRRKFDESHSCEQPLRGKASDRSQQISASMAAPAILLGCSFQQSVPDTTYMRPVAVVSSLARALAAIVLGDPKLVIIIPD